MCSSALPLAYAGCAEEQQDEEREEGPDDLLKPTAISGKPARFEEYYKDNTQRQKDRELFSH